MREHKRVFAIAPYRDVVSANTSPVHHVSIIPTSQLEKSYRGDAGRVKGGVMLILIDR